MFLFCVRMKRIAVFVILCRRLVASPVMCIAIIIIYLKTLIYQVQCDGFSLNLLVKLFHLKSM